MQELRTTWSFGPDGPEEHISLPLVAQAEISFNVFFPLEMKWRDVFWEVI